MDDISFTWPYKDMACSAEWGREVTLLNIITNRIFPTAGTVGLGDQDDNDDVLSAGSSDE